MLFEGKGESSLLIGYVKRMKLNLDLEAANAKGHSHVVVLNPIMGEMQLISSHPNYDEARKALPTSRGNMIYPLEGLQRSLKEAAG